jgi:hypothetical protein
MTDKALYIDPAYLRRLIAAGKLPPIKRPKSKWARPVFFEIENSLISRDGSGQAVVERNVRDAGHFLPVEVQLIVIGEWVKLTLLDHSQHGPATAMQ